MAYRDIEVNFTGQEGIEPRLDRMKTSDTLATILTPGYLNKAAQSAGVSLMPTDLMAINYSNGDGTFSSNWFALVYDANGIITLSKETSNVSGPGSSYDNQVVLFAGTSGSEIKGVGFTPVDNSLFGFNGTATPSNITAGTNISISGGVISATGSGTGNVVGPASATSGGIAFYADTTGKLLENTPFSPSANSLLGYNGSGIPENITAGTNVSISGGVISVVSGAGNVTGTGTPAALTFPVYADTTGVAIEPSAVALTNNTLVGVNSGALANITAGSGITISGGVIASSAGGGNVTGSGTSVTGLFPVYTDTTGLDIAPGTFSLTNGTLLGFNAGAIANITAGTGITISGGVISAPGAGGTITGPGSAALGALAVWDNVNGKVLSEPLYGTPAPNSLVGYGPSGNGIVNITAGANINISDSGVISASGGGGGGGDVTGPTTSIDAGLVLFSGTSGKFIDNVYFTPGANSLLGFRSDGSVQNVITNTVATGLQCNGPTLYTQLGRTQVVGGGFTATNQNLNSIIEFSTSATFTLPASSTCNQNAIIYAKIVASGVKVTFATQGFDVIFQDGNMQFMTYGQIVFFVNAIGGWQLGNLSSGINPPVVNSITSSYIVTPRDMGSLIELNFAGTSNIVLPASSTVWDGFYINLCALQEFPTQVTLTGGSGDVLQTNAGAYMYPANTGQPQYGYIYLRSNIWHFIQFPNAGLRNFTINNAAYTVQPYDNNTYIGMNSVTGAQNVNLPASASVIEGFNFTLVQGGTSTNTLLPNGVDVILTYPGGLVTSFTTAGKGAAYSVVKNGSVWIVS